MESNTSLSTPSSSSKSLSINRSKNDQQLTEFPFKQPNSTPKKKRIVLEEDKYALQLEKIIERDYFPDLEKLGAQNAYLNAMATNDIHMLRELYSKYSFGKNTPRLKKQDALDTPSTFETPIDLQFNSKSIPTPVVESTPTHLPMEEPENNDDAASTSSKRSRKSVDKNDPSSLSLNDFLNKYTSEDNQSFQDFMEEAEKKHRIKYSWLYDTEEKEKYKKKLSLQVPSVEEQANEYNRPLDIETWGYKTKNYVMYVPDGVPFTPEEEVELAKKRAQVVFKNTRFKKTPFKEGDGPSSSTQPETPLTGGLFKNTEGKIGVDGKEIESSTPKVNGFSYVRTPSPTPGVEDSPFMTWGEIEGTPFRLDASDTPIPSANTSKPYKIFEQSKRERLALELAEKVSHRYRDKKLKAIQAARSHLKSPSTGSMSRGLERLNSMTPAAQKFAKSHFGSRLGSSDPALRNSYTPKRDSSLKGTPTPTSKNNVSTSSTPRSGTQRPSTLVTDDLLNLPTMAIGARDGEKNKRAKAADFF